MEKNKLRKIGSSSYQVLHSVFFCIDFVVLQQLREIQHWVTSLKFNIITEYVDLTCLVVFICLFQFED